MVEAVVSSSTGAVVTSYVDAGTNINYDVYTFNGAGTIVFSVAGDVDILAVGGGGSGGTTIGGGGGAGQFIEQSTAVTATSYPITIGAGGIYPGGAQVAGANGGVTTALGLTAIGGGGGGAYSSKNPKTGASGGGGGYSSQAGAIGTAGFNGGSSQGAGTGIMGGGGGAGGVGAAGSQTYSVGPGQGGIPLSSSITGTALNYAAGGCAGNFNASSLLPTVAIYPIAGSGGSRSPTVNPTAGQDNTGSGGGGGGDTSYQSGGGGGSGVVVVRINNGYRITGSTLTNTATLGSTTFISKIVNSTFADPDTLNSTFQNILVRSTVFANTNQYNANRLGNLLQYIDSALLASNTTLNSNTLQSLNISRSTDAFTAYVDFSPKTLLVEEREGGYIQLVSSYP
tara:strand:+ start:551 stop:1741 length:1191 start_codon:yes stop_codon:yes gene_type:complete